MRVFVCSDYSSPSSRDCKASSLSSRSPKVKASHGQVRSICHVKKQLLSMRKPWLFYFVTLVLKHKVTQSRLQITRDNTFFIMHMALCGCGWMWMRCKSSSRTSYKYCLIHNWASAPPCTLPACPYCANFSKAWIVHNNSLSSLLVFIRQTHCCLSFHVIQHHRRTPFHLSSSTSFLSCRHIPV